jgi:RNA polymerase sigma factor (TIGR02999 family)
VHAKIYPLRGQIIEGLDSSEHEQRYRMNVFPVQKSSDTTARDLPLAPSATRGEPKQELTALIRSASEGDMQARERLIRELYPRLRAIARYRMSGHVPPTLIDATGLLHESLAKLLDHGFEKIENTQHLVSYAAATMRHVLVDYARERNALKRDAGERVSLTLADVGQSDQGLDLVMLDEALRRLDAVDPRLTSIVELRCFGGLKIEDIASQLGVSERTVKRDWQKARAFLTMFLGTADK